MLAPSGTEVWQSLKKSTMSPLNSASRRWGPLRFISSQKSNLRRNLPTAFLCSLRVWYMWRGPSPFQIIRLELRPVRCFFSHSNMALLSVPNCPEYENILSRLPVTMVSKSMQTLRLGLAHLKRVTFPHQPYHPYSKGYTAILGSSPAPSQVKQTNLNYFEQCLRMALKSRLTQQAGQRVPHFTTSTSTQGASLKLGQPQIATGLGISHPGPISFAISCQVRETACWCIPICLRMSPRLVRATESKGLSSIERTIKRQAYSSRPELTYRTDKFVCASLQACLELSLEQNITSLNYCSTPSGSNSGL